MIENLIYREALNRIVSYVSVDGKRLLVTGASGLIGSCLIDLLMLANWQGKSNHVYALGRNKERLSKRFASFADNEYFHIIEQDICQEISDEITFDYIVHGASNADPIAYAEHPVGTMKTTLMGGINILEYGRKHKNCKMVMLSTFEVYGNAGHDTYAEQDFGVIDFNMIRACYPESKRAMEILSRCYMNEYDVQVNVARLSSIYGPTMIVTDSKAHAQFIRRALHHEDIVLKSKGEQRRSYCHVIDAVSGILTVLQFGKVGESYNVANNQAVVSIAEVAQTVAQIAGVKVVFDKPSAVEEKGFSKPQDIILDNTKLQSLGWFPKYNVKDGFEMTLKVMKWSD